MRNARDLDLETLRLEQVGRVLTAWYSSPPLNFVTTTFVADLDRLTRAVDRDSSVGAVVLASDVDGRFLTHAGAGELGAMAELPFPELPAAALRPFWRSVDAILHVPGAARLSEHLGPLGVGLVWGYRWKRTILRMNRSGAVYLAAINGPALGGGHEIALACEIGLVHRVVAADSLLAETQATAARLASRSRMAVAAAKRSVYAALDRPLRLGLDHELGAFLATGTTAYAERAFAMFGEDVERVGTPRSLPSPIPGSTERASLRSPARKADPQSEARSTMSPTTPDAGSGPLPLAADPEWRKSACILCECNCGLEIQVEGRRLARIRGDKAHPASAGYTCEKPLRLDRYQNGRDRITSPLRRTADGSYEEIDWDTAITEIAAKLEAIKTEHGGEKIFFYAGGGQGNHFPGAYGQSLRAALGTRYYSNALAQEKTGEMWVDGRLYGGHTKGDFEHSEVVLFLGKNPWQSHSFPRTRPTLREIAADPGRAMIVIDPRRTETADLADFHLQVRPGTDAWCLAAMLGVLVQEDLVDHAFIAEHTTGVEQVLTVLAEVPITEYAERCGVPEDVIRAATRRFATATSATTYEDLGIQQAPNSTLVSYLNKLLWILTGNFGRPGTMYLHSSFVAIAGTGSPSEPTSKRPRSRLRTAANRLTAKAVSLGADGVSRATVHATRTPIPDALLNRLARAAVDQMAPLLSGSLSTSVSPKGNRVTPVTGARIIGGLIPCTSIADEILTDHPERFRAMWIDSSNPAHSLPDSARFSEALRALDLVVVVDVAFTETARLADYVLPAATQFEKWEATFFNFEFPDNVFQLRAPVLDPLPGTLPEAEIYSRVLRALGAVDPDVLDRLRAAAVSGRDTFALAFFSSAAADPSLLRMAAYVLYETLGQTLPDNAAAAAFLWGVSHMCALSNPDGVARAGYDGPGLRPGEKLFEAVLSTRSGVTFTSDTWDGVWKYVRGHDRRFTVAIPSLLEDLAGLGEGPSAWTTEEFPFVLAAGERRAFTANTIIRDPDWRRRDRDGALRISPGDAESLGLQPGGGVRVITETGSAETTIEITDTLQTGHVTLPNGLGVDHPQVDGSPALTGVPLNRLTSTRYRDAVAGTPWHKYVPARLEPLE